jgi:catechol 2,3-dioxygenase-like lactoylglutathione lyase family enzyme
MTIEAISAITLATHDMGRALAFYEAMGFERRYGSAGSSFSSFHAGPGYLNIVRAAEQTNWSWWGRVIFYVDDVDAVYQQALDAGLRPEAAPRDAEWGERYFHIVDPDGHELSFARPLDRR